MKLRWGICSAGKISNDFVLALGLLNPEEHAVVAVAARSEENAKTFAEKHKIPKAYGGYEALAQDADVDIVYIGSLSISHRALCKLYLNHGKNVLCEKPLALNKREVQDIFDLAKEKDVFIMEGWWSMFFPAIVKLRELIAAGHIGEVKAVTGSFGFPILSQEPCRLKEFGGGGLVALGGSLIQMSIMVFGKDPLSWSTKGFLADTGVDETTVTTLMFPNNGVASLTCSASIFLHNSLEISGTKGHIKIPSPLWCPLTLEVSTGEKEVMEFPLHKTCKGFNYPNSAGFQYEAEAVRQCLMKGLKECPIASHKDTLLVSQIIQDSRHDVGYLMEADMEKITTMPCQ